jgi:hypothetical protein
MPGTPILTSISPSSGPPGTAITLAGSNFDVTAQVGCPALVATVWVSATQLQATVPASLSGPPAGTLVVNVYVKNSDGSLSVVILPFTAKFPYPAPEYQSWTSLVPVCGEVAGFKRGGNIADSTIEQWMRSVAQSINGALIRRGLSLNPADWQQPDPVSGNPGPGGLLEQINRLGAAARLAAAVGGQFTGGKYGLATQLSADYMREFALLENGDYDKLFNPAAATVDTGPYFGAGAMTDPNTGAPVNAFTRESIDGGSQSANESVDQDDAPGGGGPIGF